MIKLRTLLRLTILLSCWLQAHHSVLGRNVTVSDTDPSIVYQPPTSWYASTDPCAGCIKPGMSIPYHEAIHPPLIDTDGDATPLPSKPTPPPVDVPIASKSSSSVPTSSSTAKAFTPPPDDPDAGPNDPDAGSSDDSTKKSSGKGSGKRSIGARRIRLPRLDPDDPGFQDPEVSLTFDFTGSAVFVYAIQSPDTTNVNSTSSHMNLTCAVDNLTPTSNLIASTAGSTDYQPGTLVYSSSGLSEGPHQLVVKIGVNSTFIFDHLIYTTASENGTSPTPVSQSQPSTTVDPKVKKHNVATFAAAVGGSVGVLAVFSLGLCFSIIYRRRKAARRERLDGESLHTNASDDSPHMSGPAPFVPRYFPDTVIPPDPPTYMVALATNNNNSTLLATLPPEAFGSTQRAYADIPPSSPPPPSEDGLLLPPPPPFPDAELAALPQGAMAPSIPGPGRPSHNLSSVGNALSNSAAPPELVPLLQDVDADPRPLSRASTDARETASTESSTHLREDVS